tara:strand:+ start:241 stop:459 length:219 start_codon:yes stop_codon:yes gene_type:complete
MEPKEYQSSMQLTRDQALSLLREQLLDGLDSGELTEEEFVQQIKALKDIVNNCVFFLTASHTDARSTEEQNI